MSNTGSSRSANVSATDHLKMIDEADIKKETEASPMSNTVLDFIARCSLEKSHPVPEQLARRNVSNMAQLQLWAYETADLTFAEKMEKQKWERNIQRIKVSA